MKSVSLFIKFKFMNKLLVLFTTLTLFSLAPPPMPESTHFYQSLEFPCNYSPNFTFEARLTSSGGDDEGWPTITNGIGSDFSINGAFWYFLSGQWTSDQYNFAEVFDINGNPITGSMQSGIWVSDAPITEVCCDCKCYDIHLFFGSNSWGFTIGDIVETVPCGGNGGEPE